MQLSTGFIIAGAYANKIKKTLFAQLREAVAKGEVDSKEIARAAAELNQVLYRIIVDKLESDKGDVVRARVDYEVVDGKIRFKLNTLKIEYFKRVPDEEVAKHVEKTLAEVEEALAKRLAYKVEKVATTTIGDHVFRVKLEDKVVGMIAATPLEDVIAVRGAVLEPRPVAIKGKIPSADTVEEAVAGGLPGLVGAGRGVNVEEAEKAIKDLEALVSSEQ